MPQYSRGKPVIPLAQCPARLYWRKLDTARVCGPVPDRRLGFKEAVSLVSCPDKPAACRFVETRSFKAFRDSGSMQYTEFATRVGGLKSLWNTLLGMTGLGQGVSPLVSPHK